MSEQPTERRDVLLRLQLMESGRTYPAAADMGFYVVAADAITEIKRLRAALEEIEGLPLEELAQAYGIVDEALGR